MYCIVRNRQCFCTSDYREAHYMQPLLVFQGPALQFYMQLTLLPQLTIGPVLIAAFGRGAEDSLVPVLFSS
jgi:hypothetical protein